MQFLAGYADRLVVDPGAVFSGTVDGGNTIASSIVSTLELASGSSAGTLTGLGAQFIDFAQTTIDAGAAWTFTSSNYLTAGTTLTNFGTLTAFNGTLTGAGLVINNGTIIADPSTLTFASLTGTGDVIIDSGSTVITTGTVGAGETIVFSGGNGELDLAYTGFSGEISGFNATDKLGLTGITDGTSASVVNGNTLQIDRSAHPAIDLILDPRQDYTGLSFAIGPDGGISEQPVCSSPAPTSPHPTAKCRWSVWQPATVCSPSVAQPGQSSGSAPGKSPPRAGGAVPRRRSSCARARWPGTCRTAICGSPRRTRCSSTAC